MNKTDKQLIDTIAMDILSTTDPGFCKQPEIITALKIIVLYEMRTKTKLNDDELKDACEYVIKKFIAN